MRMLTVRRSDKQGRIIAARGRECMFCFEFAAMLAVREAALRKNNPRNIRRRPQRHPAGGVKF